MTGRRTNTQKSEKADSKKVAETETNSDDKTVKGQLMTPVVLLKTVQIQPGGEPVSPGEREFEDSLANELISAGLAIPKDKAESEEDILE